MKIGYSEPTLTEETLSDDSKAYGVFISGDRDIELACIDKLAAENPIAVWNYSVVSVDIT